MDFLGAMFEGIGQTFTAGKDVNLGQMAERAQKRQIEFDKFALSNSKDLAKYEFLNSQGNQQNKLNQIIIIAVVLLIAVAFYLKFK